MTSRPPFLSRQPIDVDAVEEALRSQFATQVVTYQAVVRGDRTAQGALDHLEYVAYEPMAEKEYERILEDVARQCPTAEVLAQHRLGGVRVGETSLFVAASSRKRDEAFRACHVALERIKTCVPLWKRVVMPDGNKSWSLRHHETMLLADTDVVIPQS